MSQVISFRASGHFLNWIESQRLEGESLSQCCQRMLKDVSTVPYTPSTASNDVASTVSTILSTESNDSVASTNTVDIVDKAVNSKLDPVIERMAAIEERLGKLRA